MHARLIRRARILQAMTCWCYAQNTVQRLANLLPEGERDGPKLPDCMFLRIVHYIIIIIIIIIIIFSSL